jgi:hypothetical protein
MGGIVSACVSYSYYYFYVSAFLFLWRLLLGCWVANWDTRMLVRRYAALCGVTGVVAAYLDGYNARAVIASALLLPSQRLPGKHR